MTPEEGKKIHKIGILIWAILFWIAIPINTIKKYPIVIIGYITPMIILYFNIMLIGEYDDTEKGSDLEDSQSNLKDLINSKSIHIATSTFATGYLIKDIFSKETNEDLLLFMMYAMLFSVGFIMPTFFMSNQKNNHEVYKKSEFIIRIKNISISYSVGFMLCTFLIAIFKIYNLKN